VPLSRELGPRLVQCGLGQGLLPYQAVGVGVPFFLGVSGSTSNTMSRRPRSTSVPSGILIHAVA